MGIPPMKCLDMEIDTVTMDMEKDAFINYVLSPLFYST